MSSTTAQNLANNIQQLTADLRQFVADCPDDKWQSIIPSEQWPINVTMNHILTGHFAIIGLIKRKLRDQPLPELTNQFIESANQANATLSTEVTKEDINDLIEKYADKSAEFVRNLSPQELDQSIYFGPTDSDLAIGKIINLSLVHSANDHLAHAKKTAGLPIK